MEEGRGDFWVRGFLDCDDGRMRGGCRKGIRYYVIYVVITV